MVTLVLLCSAASAALPVSRRSREISTRIKPVLQEELRAAGYSWGAPVFVRIFKQPGQLELWLEKDGRFGLFKTYDVCSFGGKGIGPKTMQGDGRAPEGFYFVTARQMNPFSRFHLAFNLGYPNRYDRHRGRTGSALMVHGGCVSIGCFAMTDNGIEEIYVLAEAALCGGQPFFRVHIFPFHMTPENMHRYRRSVWIGFWKNLQTGYRWFENTKTVPDTVVMQGRYVFR